MRIDLSLLSRLNSLKLLALFRLDLYPADLHRRQEVTQVPQLQAFLYLHRPLLLVLICTALGLLQIAYLSYRSPRQGLQVGDIVVQLSGRRTVPQTRAVPRILRLPWIHSPHLRTLARNHFPPQRTHQHLHRRMSCIRWRLAPVLPTLPRFLCHRLPLPVLGPLVLLEYRFRHRPRAALVLCTLTGHALAAVAMSLEVLFLSTTHISYRSWYISCRSYDYHVSDDPMCSHPPLTAVS